MTDTYPFATAGYLDQAARWPDQGRHILAHFDDDTIIVYQAYRPEIGNDAAAHDKFGGEFKYTRMSWIKPNFLWMMYRSNWGRSKGQEVVLAIRLSRRFFDSLLAAAVPSSYVPELYSDREAWQREVQNSDVRLQWDPDHLPGGDKCERRAIQLGMRGEVLEAYGKREAIEIIDISEFVAEQREYIDRARQSELQTPVEHVYQPAGAEIAQHIGLEEWPWVLEQE